MIFIFIFRFFNFYN